MGAQRFGNTPDGLLLIEEGIEDYKLAVSDTVSTYVSLMMHRLARITVQIEVLQNDATEWFKLIGVRGHFGVAQASAERDHAATRR